MSYIRFVELGTLTLFLGMVLLLDVGRRLGRAVARSGGARKSVSAAKRRLR